MHKYGVNHSDLVMFHSATEKNVPDATATLLNSKVKLAVEHLEMMFSVFQHRIDNLL